MAKVVKKPNNDIMIYSNNHNVNLSIVGAEEYETCEFCIKFDDDEPFVFATGSPMGGKNPKVTFTLSNRADSQITFHNNETGKRVKLFTRKKQH